LARYPIGIFVPVAMSRVTTALAVRRREEDDHAEGVLGSL
jgi:hypothetical protein